jgi:hypothetical protein
MKKRTSTTASKTSTFYLEVGLDNFRIAPVGGATDAYKFVEWTELE